MRESPFDRTLFLDTDTTTVRPIDGLFNLLDRFDIGLYMLPHYTDHPKYRYLNNPSSGVVLFRRCEAVSETFDRWLELFDQEISATEARTSNSQFRINDDPQLMRAIYETRSRLVPLPAAMNFHLEVPTVTASPIHIVHGRHPDPVGLARRVDQGRPAGLPNWNPRVSGSAAPIATSRWQPSKPCDLASCAALCHACCCITAMGARLSAQVTPTFIQDPTPVRSWAPQIHPSQFGTGPPRFDRFGHLQKTGKRSARRCVHCPRDHHKHFTNRIWLAVYCGIAVCKRAKSRRPWRGLTARICVTV